MKVSWQVTGVRKDPFANANRIPVEIDKPEDERGSYLHPEAYGKSQLKSVELVKNPKLHAEKIKALAEETEDDAQANANEHDVDSESNDVQGTR